MTKFRCIKVGIQKDNNKRITLKYTKMNFYCLLSNEIWFHNRPLLIVLILDNWKTKNENSAWLNAQEIFISLVKHVR